MEGNLEKLYFDFLKFQEKNFLKDKKFWFGVKEGRVSEKKIKEIFLNYEKESFLGFLKKIKDIIFSKEPLKETLFKWSTDNWYPYYYFKFLSEKGIISFKKNGKIILRNKEIFKKIPKPLKEEEIKEKIERKLKRKLKMDEPSNYFFATKTKPHYDQLPISVSSVIFIISKILEYLPLPGKFLFVGDDDLVSLFLSLADENIESLVVDIDAQLLKNIREKAKNFGLKIETKKVDILKTKKLKEKFIAFLTSPVYTFEGVKSFFNFGVNQFGKEGGYSFLNLADEAIGNRYLFLEKFFAQKKLIIEEVINGKIYYPWKIVHPEEKMILENYKKLFSQKVVEGSPLICSSLWIFNFVPFKITKPPKLPIYVYL